MSGVSLLRPAKPGRLENGAPLGRSMDARAVRLPELAVQEVLLTQA